MNIVDDDQRLQLRENFKKLRENTQWNVIVLLWLGIIDLDKFVVFMIKDDEVKVKIRNLYN